MSSTSIEVPEAVLRKAGALGPAGARWLDELPRVVAQLEREWRIEVGGPIVGGSAAYVAEAVTADGRAAVLKIAIPEGLSGQGAFARELATLRLGAGRGYVQVFEGDAARGVMLQARLGRRLNELALPVESQIAIIAALLRLSWHRPVAPALRTGREQAEELAIDIVARWEQLRRPCSSDTLEQAVRYAHARGDAFDPDSSVLIHGDAHPANLLESEPGGGALGGFTLIDPDGMFSEPAHDLAIPLRDWSPELLAGDPVRLGLEWCARLGRLAQVDPTAIWQWAFLERVSTGLFMTSLGDPYGEQILEVAAAWTGTEPSLPHLRSAP